MRKFFTFFAAALMSVGMFGATVQENKSLDASEWWGWNSTQANVESKLEGTITGAYGAIGTSFENANWSGWNKLVVVVDNIEGCVGEYWYLKAELRDNSFDPNASENVTMSGELGIEGHDPHETNYVVIEFASVPEGFDITNVSQLVLQSAATGSFTVSRIFLEKGTAQDPVTEDITLDASAWWGWDSSHKNVDGKLLGTVTDTWGAIATNLDNADWSEWSKLVVVVDNIEGCEGQYWYLKAEIRNPGYEYPTSVTMSGELGIEGHDPHETNYVVIDLTAVPDGFDITNVDALVLQSAVTGSFTVSRIFLEKEVPDPEPEPEPTPEPQMLTEDITLDASAWWGWDSSKENVDGKLAGTITDAYGAIATSFGNANWSGWNKLVVVVDNIEGCEGQYWYLKAELRDNSFDPNASENVTMSGELGIVGHNPNETNYVVIDLTAVPDGFDITNVDALVLQSEATGSFTVSRIFLEKPAPAEDVNITPNVDPDHAGVYYSTFFDSANKYALPAGVEAYVATRDGANLLLSKIADAGQTIPADNAVILKSSVTPFTLTPSDAETVPVNAINSLKGTDVAIATPANCYVLGGADGVVGFYKYSGTNLNPHKAYVVFSGSNQAPRRMPFIFDAATGVENVQGNVQSTKVLRDGQLIIIRNGVEYNANGMMVK